MNAYKCIEKSKFSNTVVQNCIGCSPDYITVQNSIEGKQLESRFMSVPSTLKACYANPTFYKTKTN